MISVVMPAFNAEQFLAPAIESILGQTYRDFELVIVDDGSSDHTPDIARAYASQDGRVRLIAGQRLGQARARNLGLAEAKNPWIAVMDADDIALPERLDMQLRMAAADPEVVVWGSAAYHVGVDGQVLSLFRSGPCSKDEFMAMRGRAEIIQVIHSTAFYRRDLALQIGGYDCGFSVAGDAEFFDRMALHGCILSLPAPLLKYRLHGSSQTVVRFREQQRNARYVRDRQRRRLLGEPPITLAAFAEQLDQESAWNRFRRWQEDMEDLFYIEAGTAFGQHRPLQAAHYFLLSLLINPFFAIPKLWKSRFSAASRSAIHVSA